MKLPSLSNSRSAPSLRSRQASDGRSQASSLQDHGRGSGDPACGLAMASGTNHELRRKILEALTHPDVQSLAAKFYEAELPNRNGKLGIKELRRAFRALNDGLGVPLPTLQVAEQLFKRYDFDGDGCLSKDEFYELFVSCLRRFAFDRSTLLGREVFVAKERGKVWESYDCLSKLGTGSFAVAYLARHKRTGDERVIKAAAKSRVRLPVEDIEREIMVMMELDHPHVIRLYGWYEGSSSIYLVLDPLEGGTLRDAALQVVQGQTRGVPEEWIRKVMKQCTEAMSYCHSKRVIHKDLKDENVMLLKKDPDYLQPHAVIIDLGVSEMFGIADHTGKMMAGTPATMAPEVWAGAFGPKCDVWSLGCILFELLAGDVPFFTRSLEAKDWRSLHKRGPNWTPLHNTKVGRDLCCEMLKFDERERPTMAACLRHAWYAEALKTPYVIPSEQFSRLEKFSRESALKRAIVFEIASRLPLQHSDRVVQFFKAIDENRDGQISRQELANGFRRFGLKDAKILDRTFEALDVDGDGFLSLNELSAGVLMMFTDLLEERFQALFRKYDRDSNGVLNESEIVEFMTAASLLVARKGRSPEKMVQDVVRESGGSLSYEDARAKLLVGAS